MLPRRARPRQRGQVPKMSCRLHSKKLPYDKKLVSPENVNHYNDARRFTAMTRHRPFFRTRVLMSRHAAPGWTAENRTVKWWQLAMPERRHWFCFAATISHEALGRSCPVDVAPAFKPRSIPRATPETCTHAHRNAPQIPSMKNNDAQNEHLH